MEETYKCPGCGVQTLIQYSDPLMLPKLIKVDSGNGISVDLKHGIAVRAWICTTCKHIEFKAVIGNDDLKS